MGPCRFSGYTLWWVYYWDFVLFRTVETSVVFRNKWKNFFTIQVIHHSFTNFYWLNRVFIRIKNFRFPMGVRVNNLYVCVHLRKTDAVNVPLYTRYYKYLFWNLFQYQIIRTVWEAQKDHILKKSSLYGEVSIRCKKKISNVLFYLISTHVLRWTY